MKKYESVFFIPWPPLNFHLNRGDVLLKIRGGPWTLVHGPGPWGGPWTRSMFCIRPSKTRVSLLINKLGSQFSDCQKQFSLPSSLHETFIKSRFLITCSKTRPTLSFSEKSLPPLRASTASWSCCWILFNNFTLFSVISSKDSLEKSSKVSSILSKDLYSHSPLRLPGKICNIHAEK